MELNVAKKYVNLIFSNTHCGNIIIVFHGGEPTLQSLEWYTALIEFIEIQATHYNKVIKFTMQSNCLNLSDDYLDLFKNKKVIIGASLDGPSEINDLTRANGAVVLTNILKLKTYDLLGGVICVITERNCDKVPEILHFFEEMGIYSVNFNIFYSVGGGRKLRPLSAKQIFGTYKHTYEYLKATRGKRIIERSVAIMVSKFFKPLTNKETLNNLNCYSPFCHAAISTVLCDTEGDLFPCGCSDSPKFKLGSIYSMDVKHYLNVARLLHKKDEKYNKICSHCFANTICSFGCPAYYNDDTVTHRNLCAATKKFYQFLEGESKDNIKNIAKASKICFNK